jgi:hypothetical protein
VQLDSIKPMLKPPGTKRLTQKHDEPLSSFAFNFNLRRYNLDLSFNGLDRHCFLPLSTLRRLQTLNLVGRSKLTLSNLC